MKQIARKIVLACMAAVISLTGMGTTIANFCCDNCSSNFWTKIDISSSDNQHKETDHHHGCCCPVKEKKDIATCQNHDNDNDKECCGLERHSTILDSFHSKPVVFVPYSWVTDIFLTLQADLSGQTYNDFVFNNSEDPPKIESPRKYLSLIRILII